MVVRAQLLAPHQARQSVWRLPQEGRPSRFHRKPASRVPALSGREYPLVREPHCWEDEHMKNTILAMASLVLAGLRCGGAEIPTFHAYIESDFCALLVFGLHYN